MTPDAVRQRVNRMEDGLSPWAARAETGRGRHRVEAPPPLRGDFQLDRERILGTNAFRRLKHKTQVFIAPQGDHYVTRLTHTLEVCQIARTIARALRLNEDLSEAIALGHDLGHTAFGHTGEEALRGLYPGGFSHAAQSLRVVETLERDGVGLNLTWETRQGVLGHSKPRGDFLAAPVPQGTTLEAQVCRLADAFAYLNHDVRDALRARILRVEDLPGEARRLLGDSPAAWLDAFVLDAVESSWGVAGGGGPPGGEAPAITMSPRMRPIMVRCREFMFDTVYEPLSRSRESRAAGGVISLLYRHFCAHPEGLPPEYHLRGEPPERMALDYIAGMTDYYALSLAEGLQPGSAAGIGAWKT